MGTDRVDMTGLSAYPEVGWEGGMSIRRGAFCRQVRTFERFKV